MLVGRSGVYSKFSRTIVTWLEWKGMVKKQGKVFPLVSLTDWFPANKR